MITMGKEKIKTDKFTIHIQNNPQSVDIKDESDIPYTYYVEQQPKLDKRALLDDLKNGVKVPGVEVKQTRGVRFR